MLQIVLRRFAIGLCFCGSILALEPGIWLDVPYIRQRNEGCGSASIAMVMQYWQKQQSQLTHPGSTGRGFDPASEEPAIFRALYSEKAHGIYASDLESYLQGHGFRTFAFQGTWEDLRRHLRQGRPLIAGLKPAGALMLHYVVISGLDWEQKLIMVNDPAERKLLKQERAAFERQWRASGNWALLAVPTSDLN